jgi:hypothetical protein
MVFRSPVKPEPCADERPAALRFSIDAGAERDGTTGARAASVVGVMTPPSRGPPARPWADPVRVPRPRSGARACGRAPFALRHRR